MVARSGRGLQRCSPQWDNNIALCGIFGDLHTIEILRKAKLRNIDVHAKLEPISILTPMNWTLKPSRPTPPSDEIIANFTRLLAEIEAHTNGKISPFDLINDYEDTKSMPPTFDHIPDPDPRNTPWKSCRTMSRFF